MRVLSAAVLVAAAVLVVLCCGVPARGREAVAGSLFTYLTQSDSCVRLLTVNGTVGCATLPGGSRGTLEILRNQSALNAFLASEVSDDSAVFLADASLFTAANLRSLRTRGGVAGVLLSGTEATESALTAFSPAAADPVFNPSGNGLLGDAFPFGIVYLSPDDTAAVEALALDNERMRSDGSFVAQTAEFSYEMLGKHDTLTCLGEGQLCQPVGSYSVWTVLADSVNETAEVVMATVGMDAASLFHERAPGAEAAVSGLVATLAAHAALAAQPSLLAALPRQIAFAFFEGEAWDSVGSRRFFSDVAGFQCRKTNPDFPDSCDDPIVLDTTFVRALRNLTGPARRLRAVVEARQVGMAPSGEAADAPAKGFRVHVPAASGHLCGDALLAVAAVTAGVNVTASSVTAMPPASFQSVGDSAVPVALLSDHDAAYNTRFFASRLETASRVGLNLASSVTRITAAATLLARTLFVLASADGTPASAASSVVASEALVGELITCLTKDGDCPLDGRTVTGYSNHYASVFQLVDLDQISGMPQLVSSFVSRKYPNTTHYHQAWDPLLQYNVSTGLVELVPGAVVGSHPLYVESYWNVIGTRLYRREDPSVAVGMVIAGVVLTVASAVTTVFLNRWCASHLSVV